METAVEEEKRKRSRSKSRSKSHGSSRERSRRRRSISRSSRSRIYRRSRSRSRSISPYRGGRGGFRGGMRRFNRRSPPPPFRGGARGFRDRFKRSRSTSRGRYERRRYNQHDNRRSRSASPQSQNQNQMDSTYVHQQAQQHQNMAYGNEAYANYVPQFPGSMAQFNSYDFQTTYPPQASNFNMNMADCPAPPGLTDWQPQIEPHQMPTENEEEKKRHDAAIAEEKKRQREGLKKQLDQYISRSEKMKRELKALREQKAELMDGLGKRSPSPKTNGFIKENEKLQSQISSKLSEVLNVIDMLSGIIGKDIDEEKKSIKEKRKSSHDDSSPERIKNELLESMKRKKKEAEEKLKKINYIYYDPELHWCKICTKFPKTAQDYLNHLHSKEHLEKTASRKSDAPWRPSFQKLNEVPSHPDAQTKRAPIKGLQFFEPTNAWFCKLCEMFMGDSWCSSLHLKSAIHAERYAKFIEKEPKFEEKWLEARSKALESTGSMKIDEEKYLVKSQTQEPVADTKLTDKKSKKKKNKKDSKKKRKRGKKKKHSSSSSDSEDNSDSSSTTSSSTKKNENQSNDNKTSIRLSMRNLLSKGGTGSENDRAGWTMVDPNRDPNKPPIPPPPAISQNASKETKKDEQMIVQWNSVPIISQEEKRMLENLKGRLKQKESDKQVAPPPAPIVSRKKSRSRSKERERRNYRGRKSRSRSLRRKSVSKSKSKSPIRRRKSISKSKSRSPRRRSRSRSRNHRNRYDRNRYSRSRSRSSRRYGRNSRQMVFPAEPRLPPTREEKQPARSYTVTKREEPLGSLGGSSKKMPFIGKMPVYKRQLVEKKIEDLPEEKIEEMGITNAETLEEQNCKEDWNDLMPDPLQFSQMMSSSAPPPPVINEQHETQPDAPPGLDAEMDSDFIPKPISDAPVLRKGPLPSDFQATLDLLFDGDKPKPVVIEPIVQEIPVAEPININALDDGPQMILPEELSQHAILYGNFYQPTSDILPVPPPAAKTATIDNAKDDKNDSTETVEEADDKNKNQDMDDLAMLGIDVNDVGSGFW